MTERLLTKLLPKNAVISGEGQGGNALITGFDVAAALAYGSLSKPAYHLGRAKYCNDKAAEKKLLTHFQRKIQRKIKTRKWHDTTGRAKGLAWLVLQEGVFGIPCKRCEGRGVIWTRRKKQGLGLEKTCYYCNGTGAGQWSDSKRADVAKISKVNWIKTWKPRNDAFIHYAIDLEHKVLRHLRRQLYGTATAE